MLDLRGLDPPTIDTGLVHLLVAGQFPHWAGLPVRPALPGGNDNRTFHLGDELTVRLPSAEGYAPQVDKEHRWLPVLAPQLPLPIPVQVARGAPAEGYPFSWSVYRWLDGEAASRSAITDLTGFAVELACFLSALRRVDATGGPPVARHTGYRGGPVGFYDAETRAAIARLGDDIDGERAAGVWAAALAADDQAGAPVWFHGDVAAGNLLVRDGRLAAVIDFGCCGVGDPACDLAIAWTLLSGESRAAFRTTLGLDPATWARGRGWTLWKALITLATSIDRDPVGAGVARHVLDEVLADG